MANVPQRNVQQSYIPHDRERSICRKSSHENGLHARRHTDGPTGLNRCRSAKMCCSLNSGYPLTFRLNSRDSAALPLSVTCTSRYPGARVIHPFAGTASLAPSRRRLPDENVFRSSRDRGSKAYAVGGRSVLRQGVQAGFYRLTSGPGHLPPAIFPQHKFINIDRQLARQMIVGRSGRSED